MTNLYSIISIIMAPLLLFSWLTLCFSSVELPSPIGLMIATGVGWCSVATFICALEQLRK